MSKPIFCNIDLASVTLAIKDGTHGTHMRVKQGVPLLSAKNISASGIIEWNETDDRISLSEYRQIHKFFQLQKGDLLLTIVGSLGRRAIYKGEFVTFQRSVAYIRPNTNKVSERFLFHWFWHESFYQDLICRSNATAQAGLYLGELAKTNVPDCPRQEQDTIADILDTLDTTIRQTEAIIAKLQQVKQGLLHDLLTRGIDANSQLRPPVEQAPHLYKESPLGWIPREWEVKDLSTTCEYIVDCPHSTPNFRDDGVLVARTMHIKEGEFYITEASKVSEKEYLKRIARLKPTAGDVVFTREAPVGEAFVIPIGMNICLGQRVMLLRPRYGVLQSDFLLAQIYSGAVKERIATLTAGTTNPHLNVSEVKIFEIPLPPYEEQEAISANIEGISRRQRREHSKLEKLTKAKSALMDDLLTGRVRVTALLSKVDASP